MGFGFKSKSASTVRGGKAKMLGTIRTGQQKPGVTSSARTPSGGKFPSGGKTKMFGKSGSSPAKPC